MPLRLFKGCQACNNAVIALYNLLICLSSKYLLPRSPQVYRDISLQFQYMPRLLRTPLKTSKFVEHSFNFMLLSKRGTNLLNFYEGFSWFKPARARLGVTFIHANETLKQNIALRKSCKSSDSGAADRCRHLPGRLLQRFGARAASCALCCQRDGFRAPNEDCSSAPNFVQPNVLLIFCSTVRPDWMS